MCGAANWIFEHQNFNRIIFPKGDLDVEFNSIWRRLEGRRRDYHYIWGGLNGLLWVRAGLRVMGFGSGRAPGHGRRVMGSGSGLRVRAPGQGGDEKKT